MTFEELQKKEKEFFMPTYARFNVAPDTGKGASVYDERGKEYIDFGAGIGVNSLGFASDGWVKAVTEQLYKIQHLSNLYYSKPQILLAEKLCTLSGFSKVFLANSGAEANECAIKVARKYSFDIYGENRNTIVSLQNSFHGRTITTLSATGQDAYHQSFFPFTDGFKFASANDIHSLKQSLSSDACAVLMEPIQGEGGVLPLDKSFVKEVATICKERDILLIFDEVQTGIGRIGKLFAYEHFGILPDIMTLAKGLGGGLPIGACLCNEKLSNVLTAGTHGTTFGGNPVSCAGATYVLSVVADDTFLQNVLQKSVYVKNRLLQMRHVKEVRGQGLMIGIVLEQGNATEIATKCLENGLLILTAKDVLRLLPPLNIEQNELEKGLSILEKTLNTL